MTSVDAIAGGSAPAADAGAEPLEISVLVPVTERPAALEQIFHEFSAPFREAGTRYEFLFLVGPEHTGLARPLFALAAAGEPIRVLELGPSVTEAAMLQTGAHHALGRVLITLPAYHRVEAFALPLLVEAVREGADVVVARRWPRRDSAFSRLQNRVLHALVTGLAGNRVNDVACGVRAMRSEVLRELPLYGDFHRFLPLFAQREGFRVREVAAPQHPADVRSGIFSPAVYLGRMIDLLGLFFLLRFTDKPLRFFGAVGGVLAAVGSVLLAALAVQRLGGQPLADRPVLVVGVMLLVLGFQAIALGLIGEIVVHLSAPSRRPYRLAQALPARRRTSARAARGGPGPGAAG